MSIGFGLVCSSCRMLLDVGAAECHTCGHKLAASAAPSLEPRVVPRAAPSELSTMMLTIPTSIPAVTNPSLAALLQAAEQKGEGDDLIDDWLQERGEAPEVLPGFFEAFSVENNPDIQETNMERREQLVCYNCNFLVSAGHKFCAKCGASIEEMESLRPDTGRFGALQEPNRAKLVLIRGDSQEGVSYFLNTHDHIAGRKVGAILFPNDPYLSERHANFFYRDGQLFVRDEDSVNGVYLRLQEPVTLQSGDIFLCGEEMFRFEEVEPYEEVADEEGTYFFASPRRRTYFRIVQHVIGGFEGLRYHAKRKALVIGRERCDLNFPLDRFISGAHAKVEATENGFVLTDMGSRNGTFLRIREEVPLRNGNYVFLGQQLLRVEILS